MIPEDELRDLVRSSTSYADVMRGLGMEVNDTNHRRIRRAAARLGLDTSHFKRRAWVQPDRPAPPPIAQRVLVVLPDHAGRTNLRYLCPNCHSLTETWCRQKRRAPLAG